MYSDTSLYVIFAILFLIVVAINYGIRKSTMGTIKIHMEHAGCNDIKFFISFWSPILSTEYVDRGGNERKNRCVFLTGPFIKDGIFWEEPLNL